MLALPFLYGLYPGICLTTEEKAQHALTLERSGLKCLYAETQFVLSSDTLYRCSNARILEIFYGCFLLSKPIDRLN